MPPPSDADVFSGRKAGDHASKNGRQGVIDIRALIHVPCQMRTIHSSFLQHLSNNLAQRLFVLHLSLFHYRPKRLQDLPRRSLPAPLGLTHPRDDPLQYLGDLFHRQRLGQKLGNQRNLLLELRARRVRGVVRFRCL